MAAKAIRFSMPRASQPLFEQSSKLESTHSPKRLIQQETSSVKQNTLDKPDEFPFSNFCGFFPKLDEMKEVHFAPKPKPVTAYLH